jgi:hypothetical protein
MYYVLLTNKAENEYHIPYGKTIGINRAWHVPLKDLLRAVYQSAIIQNGWTIIKIHNDGRKEIVTLEQLEQEQPPIVETYYALNSETLRWMPSIGTTEIRHSENNHTIDTTQFRI